MHVEDHIRGVEADGGIRVHCAVVEELCGGIGGGGGGLGPGNGSKGNEQGAVDSPCIIQQYADNGLGAGGPLGVE